MSEKLSQPRQKISFKPFFNSLKARIIVSVLFMIIVLLPIVGLTISNAYEQHMKASINNELSAYSFSILAVAEIENAELMMPEQLLEAQFNVSQSGLYAFFTKTIAQLNETMKESDFLWRSQSLLTVSDLRHIKIPNLGEKQFYLANLEGVPHFVYSFTVNFSSEAGQQLMTLHIVKQRDQIEKLLQEFQQKLWSALFVLMTVLVILQLIWLMWSLKPLSLLKRELSDIEQGKSALLSEQYPNELAQVTQQLNVLLTAEQNQRKRYRNALSDLAHSLKTPLAVIKSQQNLTPQINVQLDNMNAMVEHQLKRAQSAGQSSWHLGIDVAVSVNKLIPSLQKIYADKKLNFMLNIDQEATFKGDEADLFEILGNLLDNASKAANKKVQLTVKTLMASNNKKLSMIIEDDGVGISDDMKGEILNRGTRADTYQHGHGIGLAIVRDLVESYQGSIVIETSSLGGAKFVLTFNV